MVRGERDRLAGRMIFRNAGKGFPEAEVEGDTTRTRCPPSRICWSGFGGGKRSPDRRKPDWPSPRNIRNSLRVSGSIRNHSGHAKDLGASPSHFWTGRGNSTFSVPGDGQDDVVVRKNPLGIRSRLFPVCRSPFVSPALTCLPCHPHNRPSLMNLVYYGEMR